MLLDDKSMERLNMEKLGTGFSCGRILSILLNSGDESTNSLQRASLRNVLVAMDKRIV